MKRFEVDIMAKLKSNQVRVIVWSHPRYDFKNNKPAHRSYVGVNTISGSVNIKFFDRRTRDAAIRAASRFADSVTLVK